MGLTIHPAKSNFLLSKNPFHQIIDLAYVGGLVELVCFHMSIGKLDPVFTGGDVLDQFVLCIGLIFVLVGDGLVGRPFLLSVYGMAAQAVIRAREFFAATASAFMAAASSANAADEKNRTKEPAIIPAKIFRLLVRTRRLICPPSFLKKKYLLASLHALERKNKIYKILDAFR
jgi:hypothetical protein